MARKVATLISGEGYVVTSYDIVNEEGCKASLALLHGLPQNRRVYSLDVRQQLSLASTRLTRLL
jgi:hypothetical protein